MSDRPFYALDYKTAPRQPRPGEHLLAIRKVGQPVSRNGPPT
jgi:hypothetical protein